MYEYLDHITPGMDLEISNEFMKILKKQNIKFHLNTKVTKIKKNTNLVSISTTNKNGETNVFESNVALISIGRKPFTSKLNLEKIGVETDSKGRIKIDSKFRTSKPNIYAIGDVTHGFMLLIKQRKRALLLQK